MSDRLTDPDTVLTLLRPTLKADPDWAQLELHRITTTTARRTSRRWLTTGGATVAAIALGGAAYAGGLVPDAVVERLGSGDQTDAINRVGDVRQVFDLTTRDGTYVQFFAAPNDAGGYCWTVTHNLPPTADPRDLGYGCVSGPANTLDDGVGVVPTDSEHPGPPILFGLNLGTFDLPPGTRQIHVTGPGTDHTVSATTAEGWAVELPNNSTHATYRVEFTGLAGQVLGTVTEEVDR